MLRQSVLAILAHEASADAAAEGLDAASTTAPADPSVKDDRMTSPIDGA